MRRGLRWSLTGVVGLMVAAGLWVIPALGQGPITTDVGTVRLKLSSSGPDRVTFTPDSGAVRTQNLSQTNCRLTSTGPDSLLAFGAVDPNANDNKVPYAGLKDHRIGVGQNGEGNGEPCARINQSLGQALKVSLTGPLDGMAVDYAEIDLGFKFNGEAVFELRRGGLLVDTVPVPCNGQSDCGPDSGGNDNLRVILDSRPVPVAGATVINGPFDTIIISTSTTGGAVSLEGGLGGTGDTIFHIVEAFDGEIDCGETEIIIESANATFQTTRGLDTNGGCKGPEDGLLFSFAAGTEGEELFVDFITEPVDGNPATVAQFVEVITWRFANPPNVSAGEPQLGTLSYDDHVGAGKRIMPWCLKDPRVGGSLPAPINPATIAPAGHTSCLIESKGIVTLLGDFVKVDVVYNFGDGKRWSN